MTGVHRCPRCDRRLWTEDRRHACAAVTVTVRTYDIPKLIAWIGSQPTSEIGPESQ